MRKKLDYFGDNALNYGLLQYYIKSRMKSWVKDSIAYHEGKCMITGENSTTVHHVYSYCNILRQSMTELGYTKFYMHDKYEITSVEIDNIAKRCLELHYQSGYGAVLSKKNHVEFHGKHKRTRDPINSFIEFYIEASNGNNPETISKHLEYLNAINESTHVFKYEYDTSQYKNMYHD